LSFVLRQITRRAGGGYIVRTRALAPAEPVIGRGSDCDIQLADLAVSLRHAVLRDAGPGRVIVEGLDTARFEANGAFVSRAELAVAQKPKLIFGNHILFLEKGAEADEILITVTAREGATAATTDQQGAFSLKAVLFSQRRAAWIGLLAILLLCLALPVGQFFLTHNQARIASDGSARQWSSGPLSPGHHFLEKNCEACHQQAFVAVRDTACLACHQPGLGKVAALQIASEMRGAGSPFAPSPAPDHASPERLLIATPVSADPGQRVQDWFSRTFDHPNNRCASCHTEHVGTGKSPVTGKAGAPPPVTPEELARNDCAGCHATLAQRLPDTKIPNVADWGHHPDFRPLITVSDTGGKPHLERLALSTSPLENSGLKFSHQDHLSAKGGVARMAVELGRPQGYGAPLACADCHRPDASAKGFLPIEMTRDCAACHTLAFARTDAGLKMLPHGHPDQVVAALRAYYGLQAGASSGVNSRFAWRPGMPIPTEVRGAPSVEDSVAAGVRAAFAPGGTCYDCHTVIPPSDPRSLAFGIAPVHLTDRYLPDGAFDHSVPEHRQDANGAPTCDTCHKAKESVRAADVLLPRIATCDTCHGKSESQIATAAGSDCAECHGFHDTGSPMPARREALAQD
jgi:hypothetical protein